jgi:hypothetical protein
VCAAASGAADLAHPDLANVAPSNVRRLEMRPKFEAPVQRVS